MLLLLQVLLDWHRADHVRLVFHIVLEDPLGRYRFRDYLVSVGAATAELDMWLDLQRHAALYQALQANAEALHGNDTYPWLSKAY
jgi:hypothetical protein